MQREKSPIYDCVCMTMATVKRALYGVKRVLCMTTGTTVTCAGKLSLRTQGTHVTQEKEGALRSEGKSPARSMSFEETFTRAH